MARAALSQEQIHDFRQRAIQEATSLYVEGGLGALTIRGLAIRLGCSAMTPYRYFENLDELIAMVRADGFRRFADQQEAALAAGDEAEDSLLKLKHAYIEFALREPEIYTIMFQLPREDSQDFEELKSESRRGFSFLVQAAELAVTEGMFEGDPLTVAHVLWANTHGLVSLHLSGKLLMGRSLSELSQIALDITQT